jgi:RimJ/RimL family protein N-acetyltransferase
MHLQHLKIETERLVIRSLTASDHPAYFKIFGNPNIALYDDFTPIAPSEAIENIATIIENYKSNHPEQEFAVALPAGNATIGILYMNREPHRTLIGYHFNELFQGNGYALEAVSAFIKWISETNKNPVEALVDRQNLPSLRLLKKTGFKPVDQNGDELVFRLAAEDDHGSETIKTTSAIAV